MAQQDINIGTENAKAGDNLFTAFTKIQENLTELYSHNLESHIVANQSNLATTLGGTIDSTKVYVIDGVLDFTGTGLNISVPSGGINIIGSTFDVSKLICSDINYTMFDSITGGSGNILGLSYAVEVTGAGSQVYDIVDATGFNAFEFTRVNYNGCTSLGTIDSYRQGLEEGTGRFGGSPSLTLKGTWVGGYRITTSITRNMLDTTTEPMFKAGAGFTMGSRFLTDMNVDLGTLQPFMDFAPANFAKPSSLQIIGAIITRDFNSDSLDANILPNISAADVASKFKGNSGLANTFVGGIMGVTSETTTTISSTGTFFDVAGTFTASDLVHFESSTNAQLKHIGDDPIEFRTMASVTIDGPPNDSVSMRVKRYNSKTLAFEFLPAQTRQINSLIGGADVGFFALLNNVQMCNGDYIQLQVANNSSTGNLTALIGSFINVDER